MSKNTGMQAVLVVAIVAAVMALLAFVVAPGLGKLFFHTGAETERQNREQMEPVPLEKRYPETDGIPPLGADENE